MSVYLRDIPLDEARSAFENELMASGLWGVLGRETIPLDENATGRVLAEPIWARISSPHYHASAMDGFAVSSDDTNGAQPTHPIILEVSSKAIYLDTGDPVPTGFDAVIPIENVETLDETRNITQSIRKPAAIRIRAAVTPWSDVRPMGEDIVQTQLVLAFGQVLRPVDLGAIAAAGYQSILVARNPRVAILPTGSELVPIGSELRAGDILEYNSLVLASQVKVWGGIPIRFPIIPDDFDSICACIEKAACTDNDLILINAGTSAGAEDFTARAIEKMGKVVVHGVAVRPGHPVILGVINRSNLEDGKSTGKEKIAIIGVPGYPVSAALTGEIFIEPLLAKWLGRNQNQYPILKAQLTKKITSPGGDDDYVRVVVGRVGKKTLAAPLSRGAGVITSLVRADGIVVLPRGIQGAEAGEVVAVHLYKSEGEIDNTVFCIGSHDMTIDLLAQFLSERDRRLVSANVGSQGGLIALRRGEAHLAGSHLLDTETGEYNIPSIHKYLPDVPVRVYAFVGRQQGLIIGKGNPKGIRGLIDLTRSEIRFINRQRGAGTRVLLDHELSKMGIPVISIQGYNQEEYTHLGVAAAVASGRADCGLGIPAAAASLGLDFIPLFEESYQLVIPKVYADSILLAPVFEAMDSSVFKRAVENMPGYDVSQMGKLIADV